MESIDNEKCFKRGKKSNIFFLYIYMCHECILRARVYTDFVLNCFVRTFYLSLQYKTSIYTLAAATAVFLKQIYRHTNMTKIKNTFSQHSCNIYSLSILFSPIRLLLPIDLNITIARKSISTE